MIIILEGGDGTGKTTLAQAIVQRTGARYVHNSVPRPADKPLDYWMQNILPHRGLTVIDRLHMSEDVYGRLFRDGSALTDLDRWQLEGWLLAQGAIVVRCRPPLGAVLENTQRTLSELHHGRAGIVYHGFSAPWPTLLPVVDFDYTRERVGEFARDITEVARGRAVLDFTHEGIGAAQPEIVLVADRHNTCSVGCFSPFVLRCSAGDYLRRAMAIVGLGLGRCQVINGWRLMGDGKYKINDSVTALRSPHRRFIALGRRAERALLAADISSHGFAYHPQHARRFHYSELADYAATLARQV